MRTSLAFLFGTVLAASLGSVRGVPRVSPPVREVLSLHVGDTLFPRYAVRTDTVLGVATGIIVAKRCGASKVFLRLWRANAAVSNDTVDVTVFGCAVAVAPVLDSLTYAQRLPSGALVIAPPAHLTLYAGGPPSCIYVIRRHPDGTLVTGQPAPLHIADTMIARVLTDSLSAARCPDTTVDPARIPSLSR